MNRHFPLLFLLALTPSACDRDTPLADSVAIIPPETTIIADVGGAADNRQQAYMQALAYTFLRQRLMQARD